MLLSLFISIVFCLTSYALELQAPPSRLLFVSPAIQSHIKDLVSIARALPLRHHVTFAVVDEYAHIVRDRLQPYRSFTILSLGPMLKKKQIYEVRPGESNLQFLSRVGGLDLFYDYLQMHDPLLAHLQNHSYDMMVLDFLAFAAQDLAHDLGVPMVLHSCLIIDERLYSPAWIPQYFQFVSQQQLLHSFFQRFYNQIVSQFLLKYYFGSSKNGFNPLRRTFNRTLKTGSGLLIPHWDDYPVLISNTIALEFKYSYKPNHYFLGFILDDQKNNRTEGDEQLHIVETWLNATHTSDEFVVLVAFGTLVVLRAEIWQKIIDTLHYVPHMRLLLVIPQQTIRAKFETLLLSSISYSSRILVVPWIEQQRVLAHPSVRLFVGHGGLHNTAESVYAHVPIIILPNFGDQQTVAAKVMEAKIGYAVEIDVLTTKQLVSYIEIIFGDYENFVKRLIRIHQISELEGGARRAASLIDGWLLTGYTHLITNEHKLPFIVASSLDVQLTLLVIIILIFYSMFRLIKYILYSCLHRKKLKQS